MTDKAEAEILKMTKLLYARANSIPHQLWHRVKTIYRKLRLVLRCIPKIYRLYIWDSGFLYGMINIALEELELFWSNPKNVHIIEASRKRNLKNIKTLRHLINRIIEEDYKDHPFDRVEQPEHESIPLKNEAGKIEFYEWKSLYLDEGHEERFNKQIKRQQKREKELSKVDFDLFCKIFSRCSQRFWD